MLFLNFKNAKRKIGESRSVGVIWCNEMIFCLFRFCVRSICYIWDPLICILTDWFSTLIFRSKIYWEFIGVFCEVGAMFSLCFTWIVNWTTLLNTSASFAIHGWVCIYSACVCFWISKLIILFCWSGCLSLPQYHDDLITVALS